MHLVLISFGVLVLVLNVHGTLLNDSMSRYLQEEHDRNALKQAQLEAEAKYESDLKALQQAQLEAEAKLEKAKNESIKAYRQALKKVGWISATRNDIMNANVSDFTLPTENVGGCVWRGHAPFCDDWRTCPNNEYKIMRKAATPQYPDNEDENDESFGKTCWSSKKIFCCRRTRKDATWAGKWISVKTGRIMNCTYDFDAQDSVCGGLNCTLKGNTYKASIGKNCNRFSMNNRDARADIGQIEFEDETFLKMEAEFLYAYVEPTLDNIPVLENTPVVENTTVAEPQSTLASNITATDEEAPSTSPPK